ncbi:transmembrane protein 53-like [Macadamia integrifolia]|uniref:transmembrane protein 53-like n=1 Tax=Macadamia integrifolia TaxID=60698 RepID=UPI001C500484|nr:transmembrane protein 53-like [Macadamia integrifolia]XP_042486245.1 transmembrane protein 53-like [Macadamia integrifolia]XP_042486246.1 transmembrane protein 53-like [Macadamia integrifolia]XP_042486247.1 transmembrane protein 53-like [Macadamia integrifolia]
MGSMSGILQRPLTAVAGVAVAAISADLADKLSPTKSSDPCFSSETLSSSYQSLVEEPRSWVSQISVSNVRNLSFATRVQNPVPNINYPLPYSSFPNAFSSWFNSLSTCVASPPVLVTSYQSAELAKAPKASEYIHFIPSSPSEVLYKWHLPDPNAYGVSGNSECSFAKSRTVVVLLGWLGAKQKHLKRYADWYTSRGFHVITFTFPMAEILSYQIGEKAEQDIELLANHLAGWLEEEHGKNLIFHTFSNTGWLTYGVILEKFQKQDPTLMGNIRACIVDSAPVAAPDPQVWASGFSAAFLKKQSITTKGLAGADSGVEARGSSKSEEHKPAVTEKVLLVVLEKFFEVVLNLPKVNRRLSDVLALLSSKQPRCPQLYIYSTADRVIPAEAVESFIEKQRRAGHVVSACNFLSTPHVDHFRNDPNLYTSQLTKFLEDSAHFL